MASSEQADLSKTDKGEWLLFKQEVKGKPVQELVVDPAAKASKPADSKTNALG